MQLVCVYIQDFKVIKDLLFPINSAFEVNFDKEILRIKKREKDTEYYNGVNISALMGRNGVGKSTFFEFLEASYYSEDIAGFSIWFDKENDRLSICDLNLYLQAHQIFAELPFDIQKEASLFLTSKKLRLVKANNITDVSKSLFPIKRQRHGQIVDCTLDKLTSNSKKMRRDTISNFLEFFSQSYDIFRGQRPRVEFTFHFRPASTTKILNLLRDESTLDKYKIEDFERDRLYEFSVRMLELKSINIDKVLSSQHGFHDLIIDLNILTIISYALDIRGITISEKDELTIALLLMYLDGDYVNDISPKIYRLREKHSQLISDDFHVFDKKYSDAFICISNITDLIFRNRNRFHTKFENSISTDDLDFIFELSLAINNIPHQLQRNLDYGWEGMSTGEFAKINLFSELMSVARNYGKSESLLIVIDEADLYLHPDWQRTFLSELLLLIESRFNKDNVQIILSSHSPIIIGDFLPEDIISLYQNEYGQIQIGESYGFGNQIADLFLKGMHLDSTFGKHSKELLDKIVYRSRKRMLSPLDRDRISKISDKDIQQLLLNDD